MSTEQRAEIVAKIDILRGVSEADDSPENRKARLGVVATMLMAYPMAGGSEESGRARAQAYLSAIDDVPPWAVADAIRHWYRGEGGGKDANYRFAPAPAELRYGALQVLQPARQVVAHLEGLLSALTIERAMDPAPIETAPRRPILRAIP